jgi:hypothetical protein
MKFFALKLWAGALMLPVLATSAVNFFDPSNPDAVPETITETGIYTSVAAKTLDPSLKYFEVNAALWSDHAHKDRWIILPAGQSITYNDTTDAFTYPDGTIFVKLFRHDTVNGDSSSRIYWETRLLVKKSGPERNWYGFSYKWNKGATEAYLVDQLAGMDTVITLPQSPYYRKWHFPSAADCDACHRVSATGRAVLGFFPAQLKRPSKANPSINQVTALFTAGVFTGTQPTATLGKRWRGISEPVPSGLSELERFKVLDTMARAYIAANCSGCHGHRGLEDGATGHAPHLNYDYYNLKPEMEFGYKGTGSWDLDLSLSELNAGDTLFRPKGRYLYELALQDAGISTAPGGSFPLHVPSSSSFPSTVSPVPSLITPGYPAYSTLIYRQVARKTAMMDSMDVFRALGPLDGGDPTNMKRWLFKAKWGSKAWRDSLAAHGVAMSTILDGAKFGSDFAQMPPLATYVPDTAALKILGEWALKYRTLVRVAGEDSVVTLNGKRIAARTETPVLRNRQLFVPAGWTGKAVMTSLNGRSYPLTSVGRGRYALPASLPTGIYFFRIGDRSFRASVLK